MKKFIHLIDGYPAEYQGDQICYASIRIGIKIIDSINQIKKEQMAQEK